MKRALAAAGILGSVISLSLGAHAQNGLPRVTANDNRAPAGRVERDTLRLYLEVRRARWFPEKDTGPHIVVEAFGEVGRAPSIPAPLIRVPEGRVIRARVRNRLSDSTIHVIGLATQPIPEADTLHVKPGGVSEVVFRAGPPGTYIYRAVIGNDPDGRPSERETAGGAFVVDPARGSPPDRVFVLNLISVPVDSTRNRNALAINGRAWPYTERIAMAVGDSARWRVVNGTVRTHPMHLHGFYFRVDATGDGRTSREIPDSLRRLAVTEPMPAWQTRTLSWSPDRPGNWLFHCHLAFHVTPRSRLYDGPEPTEHAHSSDPSEHMAGLVLGISVSGERSAGQNDAAVRRLDLHFLQGPARGRFTERFSYVLQNGPTVPRADSVSVPGSTLVVHRGEPTDIVVHNRAREGVGIHWHGIELESWSDGVVGWSGSGTLVAPPVPPGDSFRARLSLPRSGTFMYHTHMNDITQITNGAAGPLIVLEPGERFDPSRDHVYLVQWHGEPEPLHSPAILVNGDSLVSPPRELLAGIPHRFRLINIGAAGAVRFSLLRDTTLATWRLLAKDGADLPQSQRAMRPATQALFVGETWDFEFTPEHPGVYDLVARQITVPGFAGAVVPWRQRLVFRGP